MPISDTINVTTNIQAPTVTRDGFGIAIVFAILTAPQVAAFGSARHVELVPSSWKTTLEGLGFTTSDQAYKDIAGHFGQSFKPVRAYLVRRDTPVAQVRTYQVTGATDGTYTVTLNGTGHPFVASGSTVTAIRDDLVTQINGGAQAALVTAAPVSTDSMTVTSDVDGLSFTSAVSSTGSSITETLTTPNTGIAEDKALFDAVIKNYWAITETSRSDAAALEMSKAVLGESRGYFHQTSDATVQTAATTDIASQLQDLQYGNVFTVWHGDDTEPVAASWLGRMLPRDPGTVSWEHTTIQGVPGIVPTSVSNLEAKRVAWNENYASLSRTAMRGGRASNGTWVDLVRGAHMLNSKLEEGLLQFLIDADRVPGDDTGRDIIEGAIRGILTDEGAGFIDSESIEITVPAKADRSASDISDRIWSGITWSATAIGATSKLVITGEIQE